MYKVSVYDSYSAGWGERRRQKSLNHCHTTVRSEHLFCSGVESCKCMYSVDLYIFVYRLKGKIRQIFHNCLFSFGLFSLACFVDHFSCDWTKRFAYWLFTFEWGTEPKVVVETQAEDETVFRVKLDSNFTAIWFSFIPGHKTIHWLSFRFCSTLMSCACTIL